MPVNRIQAGGTAPSPDRPDFNIAAGTGVSVTASDDATNLVSKATVAITNTSMPALTMGTGHALTLAATGGLAPAVAGYTTFWSGGVGISLATSGNDTANTNGDIYWSQVHIPYNCTITGVAYLVGSVGGTDKAIVALYDNSGNLLANSALAGTTVGTAANFTPLAFTAPYAAVGPGSYFIAVQFNGTTAKWRSHTVPGLKVITGTVAGTFGTLGAITPGSTYTANQGPIGFTY